MYRVATLLSVPYVSPSPNKANNENGQKFVVMGGNR